MSEISDFQWIPQITMAKCTGCGECIDLCPTGALGWKAGKAALVTPENCRYCATCETICPSGAVELPYLVLKMDAAKRGKS